MIPNTIPVRYLLTLVLVLPLIPLVGVAQKECLPNNCVKLTLLHTNDHHGKFWPNKNGEYGLPARKKLIDTIRQQVSQSGGHVLLFSAGDINIGKLESDLQNGLPDIIGMNAMGYDAIILGDQDFSIPAKAYQKQLELFNFPILAANIYSKKNGRRVFNPYTIYRFKNKKIAVLGLSRAYPKNFLKEPYVQDFDFRNPIEEAKKLISFLKKEHQPDAIIALSVLGYYPITDSSAKLKGDIKLARSLEPNSLQAIIGGGTHTTLCMQKDYTGYKDFIPGSTCLPDKQNGTYIMQAGDFGRYLGRADFELIDHKLRLVNYQLLPINLKKQNIQGHAEFSQKPIDQDKDLYERLYFYYQFGKILKNQPVVQLNGKFDGAPFIIRFGQSSLGNLVGTSRIDEIPIIDFSVTNSTSIHGIINKENKVNYSVSYKDISSVLPFNNKIVRVSMKGNKLKDYLAEVAIKPLGTKYYAQFAGINMRVYCNTKDKKSKVEVYQINSQPFDLEKTYHFAISKFFADGAYGYPKVNFSHTGYRDVYLLTKYLRGKKIINSSDYTNKGEVVYVSGNKVSEGCVG